MARGIDQGLSIDPIYLIGNVWHQSAHSTAYQNTKVSSTAKEQLLSGTRKRLLNIGVRGRGAQIIGSIARLVEQCICLIQSPLHPLTHVLAPRQFTGKALKH